MSDTPPTPGLVLKVEYRFPPEDAETFKQLATRMAAEGREFDGCLFLVAAQDTANPTTFYVMEGWRDRETFEAFAKSVEFKTVVKEALKLSLIERSGTIYDVAGSEPLVMEE